MLPWIFRIPSKEYEGGIIDEKEFMEKLPAVAELAIGDACTGSNPRVPVQEEMEKTSESLLLWRRYRFLSNGYDA